MGVSKAGTFYAQIKNKKRWVSELLKATASRKGQSSTRFVWAIPNGTQSAQLEFEDGTWPNNDLLLLKSCRD